MCDPIIKAENLGKKYVISHQAERERYTALRDVIMQSAAGLWHKTRDLAAGRLILQGDTQEEVWALKGINFEIEQGEVLGIIGRNGAGKSTLLKVLSRITEPSTGRVTIKGRVASLLEVGTGFHPELSGRENIYLNGAILGMHRGEIKRKFDEIVAFAEVQRYIDTPVKRYSSGMYVRLAFAVAAHLEPEVLLVDEVLAVGDVAFQRKCLGKMGEVSRAGRTVLLVSHNMASIAQLCQRCLWIDNGAIRKSGATAPIIAEYLEAFDSSNGAVELFYSKDSQKEAQVRHIRLCNQQGETTQNYECDEPIIVEFLCQVNRKLPGLFGCLAIKKPDNTKVLFSDSYDAGHNPFDNLEPGFYAVQVKIPQRSLAPGDYFVSLVLRDHHTRIDFYDMTVRFSLVDCTSRRGNNRSGFFSTLLPWEIKPEDFHAMPHD